MKPEEHLSRARQLRRSLDRLLPDPNGEHVAAITELCYGLVQHLLACGMETRHGIHIDTHVGLPRLLRRHGEDQMAMSFERLDQLRAGRWYGGKGDGKVVEECLQLGPEAQAVLTLSAEIAAECDLAYEGETVHNAFPDRGFKP